MLQKSCTYAIYSFLPTLSILKFNFQFQGQRYSLSQQVLNFQSNLKQLRSLMPASNLSQYLAKSIVMVVIGSNDYVNNYLQRSLYPTSYIYTPEQFADLLLNHYTRQLLVHNKTAQKHCVAQN